MFALAPIAMLVLASSSRSESAHKFVYPNGQLVLVTPQTVAVDPLTWPTDAQTTPARALEWSSIEYVYAKLAHAAHTHGSARFVDVGAHARKREPAAAADFWLQSSSQKSLKLTFDSALLANARSVKVAGNPVALDKLTYTGLTAVTVPYTFAGQESEDVEVELKASDGYVMRGIVPSERAFVAPTLQSTTLEALSGGSWRATTVPSVGSTVRATLTFDRAVGVSADWSVN